MRLFADLNPKIDSIVSNAGNPVLPAFNLVILAKLDNIIACLINSISYLIDLTICGLWFAQFIANVSYY